jgi:anaerobic ribonucleoside-triphosphate reductase activating protein
VALSTPWRIHAVLPRSLANGPGARFVIWTQGCTLGCPGCFNPETHQQDGERRTAEELARAVIEHSRGVEDVTITGGEPLEQPVPLAEFCARIKAETGLGIIILTGLTRREIERDQTRHDAITNADMLIAGRYNPRRHLGTGLRGSANKEYWARTTRYTPEDFAGVPDVELILSPDGTQILTGLPG